MVDELGSNLKAILTYITITKITLSMRLLKSSLHEYNFKTSNAIDEL